ncbi:GspH/FimT family pseudopilin [Candidatus Thiodictyon syntrophicum]|jgi:type IV fimbrial biogenesis protein FimT|uniref:Type II secretion system protein H n=1 Tax=Candidatus Thiodictyon syntrophicum TaxID=1166950 RepID=A0A2K8UI88_9GAMM|nr:GspH/FimT family pseudopilin [Candidatus Thiodictyon syntrophicum]AUB84851.1 hypothetical protein THSYN_19525 [Candidatus Thiodictyon syntrophicum]
MRAKRGVTLIELMITLAIMVIVLMFAAPPFGALMARNRMSTTVNNFVATLSLARSMAVMGTAPVSICSDDGNGACGGTGDWAKGALLFRDDDSNQILDGTEAVTKRLNASESTTIVANVAAVTFSQDGTATTTAAGANSTWVFCDPSGRVSPRLVAVQGGGSNYLYQHAACSL